MDREQIGFNEAGEEHLRHSSLSGKGWELEYTLGTGTNVVSMRGRAARRIAICFLAKFLCIELHAKYKLNRCCFTC